MGLLSVSLIILLSFRLPQRHQNKACSMDKRTDMSVEDATFPRHEPGR
jgi:hypothetical protein